MNDSSEKQPSSGALLLALIGLLLFVLVWFFAVWSALWAYSWRETTQRGVLANSTDWPEPVQDIDNALASKNPTSNLLEVYLRYGEPASTLSNVICRVPHSDEAWDTIQSKLDLQPVESSFSSGLREEIFSKSDVSWWPPLDHDADYFASARLLAGDEADLYVCSIDRDSDTIYIHYHFNF